ncbi:MAG TPA: serine/threonine-protein kinase [Kofleriaceae bacterium]|nr:serine/threonine-protein kinase [Kofleriaceae bacterium]
MTRAPAEVGSAANSYEILAKLAMGGMAEIFLARGASSAGVERYVVLKRVLRHRASDPHFVRMFLDEARLAAQLQHPNIAQVYDIGKLGDSFFFTMEYVHGETVRTLLQRSHALRRTIPVGSVLSIIAGSAAGLHHAHERKAMDGRPLGIVHRDVSPSNLMVSYEGTVKVVDFGVAKAEHRSTETQSGTVKGKITYMSPEQCKGSDIDRRSDLFSLGIVMWEMLTLERLFRRNSDFENMQAIVAEDVPPPSRLRPDIPPEIDHIVMTLLRKGPNDRYQSGDELHEAIEAAAVRTGSALSAASLGRYMRELFGQRPEPWIELQSNDQHPEAFTVTSEPIPGELAVSPADDFDRKLSAVPQLSVRMSAQLSAQMSAAHTPNPMPTVPLRVQAQPDLAMTVQQLPADLQKTIARPSATPMPGVPQQGGVPQQQMPNMQSASAQVPGFATTMPGTGTVQPMRAHTPSMTPGSNPQYPMLSSASHAAYVAHRQSQPSLQSIPQPESKRRIAIYILVPAVIIGVVIGLALGFGGKKKVQTANVDPGTTVEKPPDPLHVEDVTGQTDPGSAAAEVPTVPTTDTTGTTNDTRPVTTETTAGSTTETKPDTGNDTKPDTTSGTKIKPDKPKPDKKPIKTEVKKPEKPEKPEKPAEPPDVAELYKDKKYADVVATCSGTSAIVSLNSTACTLAACKMKDATKAKKWFTQVGAAKKSSVQKECAGVLPADKPEEQKCKDPMACQH